ncbi:MAG: cupin domain-containing protein [Candidatus Dormibacteraeota bacterium]|nr:cupin domain-containing protein [Candidatus Dormibacteraeota bacterium]
MEGFAVQSLASSELRAPGLVLVEWLDPGGGFDPPRYIAPLHIHHGDDEAWYVVEGRLRFRFGESEREVQAGGAALAPRGMPHTYWNPGRERTRYVLAMTPRIRDLIEALHGLEGGDVAVAAAFRDHASEYLGWPGRER